MVDQASQIQDVVCTCMDGWIELHPKVEDFNSPESTRSDDTSRCCCLDHWDNASLGRCEPVQTILDYGDLGVKTLIERRPLVVLILMSPTPKYRKTKLSNCSPSLQPMNSTPSKD